MAETTFLWDASHYDAPPAARDGIDGYTHKLTDGDHFYLDAEYGPAMEAARRLGFTILGAYHVLHGRRSLASQADWMVSCADRLTPWWRTHPSWIWQIDAEPFDYLSAPSIDEINAFGDALAARSGLPRTRVLAYVAGWYAPYTTGRRALRYRLWHSSYGSNPQGPYRMLYPGNTSDRWRTVVDPLLLQYGSGLTIAGQTTCDANAYRGSLAQLLAALDAGNNPSTPGGEDMADIDRLVDNTDRYGFYGWQGIDPIPGIKYSDGTGHNIPNWVGQQLRAATAATAALAADLAVVKAGVAALLAGGGDTETGAILAHMDELAAEETTAQQKLYDKITGLEGQLADAHAQLANYRAAEAAGAQATADALREQ